MLRDKNNVNKLCTLTGTALRVAMMEDTDGSGSESEDAWAADGDSLD